MLRLTENFDKIDVNIVEVIQDALHFLDQEVAKLLDIRAKLDTE